MADPEETPPFNSEGEPSVSPETSKMIFSNRHANYLQIEGTVFLYEHIFLSGYLNKVNLTIS